MPYQGSSQSIGFKQRTAPDDSKRMRQRAQDYAKQRQDQVTSMERQASGQLQEMQRIDSVQRQKDQYELDKLRQFSSHLDGFLNALTKDVVKPHIDSKRLEGIEKARLYEAGDAATIAEIDGSKEQLKALEARVSEHTRKTALTLDSLEEKERAARLKKEGDTYRSTLQEQLRRENIRRLGSNVRWGFVRGSLAEQAKGFSSFLETELSSSDETINVNGKDYRIGDYYNIDDGLVRNKIVAAVQQKFIVDQETYGANDSAVLNYLTHPVVKTANEWQQKDLQRAKRDRALRQKENIENSLEINAEAFRENPLALTNSVQEILDLMPGILRDSGSGANRGVTTKDYLLKQIPKVLSHIKDDALREEIVEHLSNHKFEVGNQGAKTFAEHWGNDWNSGNILKQADVVHAKRVEDFDKAQGVLATNELSAAKAAWAAEEIDHNSYIETVGRIAEEYSSWSGITQFHTNALAWTPPNQTYEQSEANYQSLVHDRVLKEVTPEEAATFDPTFRSELDKKGLIVEKTFGNESPRTVRLIKELNTSLTNEVKNNRNDLADSETLLLDDTKTMIGIAKNKRDLIASKFFKQGFYPDTNGDPVQITTEYEAFEAANKAVIADMKIGKDQVGHWAQVDHNGFVLPGETKVGTVNWDQQRKSAVQLDDYKQRSLNTNEDLLLKPIPFLTDMDLNPKVNPLTNEYVISDRMINIGIIDSLSNTKGRDLLEVVNTQRIAHGLEPLKVQGKTFTKLREEIGKEGNEKIKSRLALATAIRDGKAEEIETDKLGFVSLPRMTNAYLTSNQPFFSLSENFGSLTNVLTEVGLPSDMTHDQLISSPESLNKVQRHLTNSMMKKASALTNNKAEMTAVGLRYGEAAMKNYQSPEYIEFANKAHRQYISGSQQEDDPGVTAITKEDYMINTVPEISGVLPPGIIREGAVVNELLEPEQRNILESDVPNDLESLETQLESLENAPQPKQLTNYQINKHKIAGKLGFKKFLPSKVSTIWNNRRNVLQSKIHIHKTINDSSNFGNSENQRVALAQAVITVLGEERFMELKEKAYATTGPSNFGVASAQELLRLLSLEPEFGGSDV